MRQGRHLPFWVRCPGAPLPGDLCPMSITGGWEGPEFNSEGGSEHRGGGGGLWGETDLGHGGPETEGLVP